MRDQRRAPVTLTLVQVTTTEDRLGNGTETEIRTVIEGAIFNPEQPLLERVGSDTQPVLQPATFNLPAVYAINSDDLLQEGADPDGTTEDPVLWLVTGGGTVWGDRTKVPVTQTRSV